MKLSSFAAVIASVGFLLINAGTPRAGVVMAETSTATAPNGETHTQEKTIYIQGNKQKVERQNVAAITDLDRNVIYLIDKQHHAYANVPLKAVKPSGQNGEPGARVTLDRTGKVRVVANNECNEYRASAGNTLERITISACVSTSAPGAKEASEFERKMIARLNGDGSNTASHNQISALMLDKKSVVSFRIPDPSQLRPYRLASLQAETRVKQIRTRPLPPETFEPPKGFSQLRKPQAGAPTTPPGEAGHAIEVAAIGTRPVPRRAPQV